jgi:hypothetical protein
MLEQLRFLAPSLLLLFGCTSSTSAVLAPTAHSGWRPVPPSELAAKCLGDAAQTCYLQGVQALNAQPPDAFSAQNLFAAACEAYNPEACNELDRHFHAPTASAVPPLSQYLPPSGYAVVEFACRVSTEGAVHSCERKRSSGSTPQFDGFLSEKLLAAQASARFVPARVDDAPYETEVRLIYILRSAGVPLIGGSVSGLPDARVMRGELGW